LISKAYTPLKKQVILGKIHLRSACNTLGNFRRF